MDQPKDQSIAEINLSAVEINRSDIKIPPEEEQHDDVRVDQFRLSLEERDNVCLRNSSANKLRDAARPVEIEEELNLFA